jgi:hypothetical protein
VEAKALFEHLLAAHPGQLDGRALRTFQRRTTDWLHRHGPPKEVFFAQVHEPGECIQTDWTNANELDVTIAGEAFPHLLCHSVLPYSNWEWATPCRSESALSLKFGLQASLWELRGVPRFSQTDQSSTAHPSAQSGREPARFQHRVCRALRAPRPRAAHDRRRQSQSKWRCRSRAGRAQAPAQKSIDPAPQPRLRVHRAYAEFVARVCGAANALRAPKLAEERARLQPLPLARFPTAEVLTVRVSSYSTARVRDCAYSVPSRLIGAFVQAHLSEETVRFVYRAEEAAVYPRSIGRAPRIDYRHVIASLVRKPGAFARYLYREEMFPRPVFRQAYDRLSAVEERKASARYLQLLQLAAEFGEDRVADLLGAVLRAGELPLADVIEVQLRESAPAQAAALAVFIPELASYDALLAEVAS